MSNWGERERKLQRLRRRNERREERRATSFDQLWIDLCWCPSCAEHCWHVEIADEPVRNGYVPSCGDCGGRLVVIDRDGRGVRHRH